MSNLPYDAIGTRKYSPTRHLYTFMFLVLFAGTFSLAIISNGIELLFINTEVVYSWENQRYSVENDWDSYTIRTQGCTIPGLTPINKDIQEYIDPPTRKIECLNSNKSLFIYNGTHITIQRHNFEYYKITEDNLILCCYMPFYRPNSVVDITAHNIDDRVKYDLCKSFNDTIEVKHEFVKAECKYQGHNEIFTHVQYYVHAIEKPLNVVPATDPLNHTRYNVIVMGLDAISRLNFYRTMPKTLKFLKDKGAVELFGYNKVGDNTFPNLIPMLLGITESELRKTCLPKSDVPFDNCPFLWSWFKENGYYTAIGEDSSYLGTFNYGRTGFYGYPVDYYLHTFINEAEDETGNAKDGNAYMCFGDRLAYKILLDYVKSLTKLLSFSKLFGFFWEVTVSHDFLSYPMFLDDDYETFFKELDLSGYLNDTILFLVSDHGMRWGDIRKTRQGRLEEMLPFVHVLTPPSFQNEYKSAFNNLKSNSRRLTTPFDIHATLEDLVTMNINDTSILSRSQIPYAYQRSISLFFPIPTNRTCETAHIADHWCTCHKEIKYNLSSIEAIEASNYLVWYMNRLLADHNECAKLNLDKIMDVTEIQVQVDTREQNRTNKSREFTVVVSTTPGGGIFEATLKRKDHFIPHESWEVTGTVSRLNLYGDQSHCVNDFHLELYCYCND